MGTFSIPPRTTGMDGATGATGSPGLIGWKQFGRCRKKFRWQGTKGANGDTGATGTLNLDCAI